MDTQTFVVISAQLVLTFLGSALVLYFVLRRFRTVSEGREHAVTETLALANRTLPYLRRGLDGRTAPHVAVTLREYLHATAVGIVSGRRILGHAGPGSDHHQEGKEPVTRMSAEVLRTGRPLVARYRHQIGCPHPGCPLAAAVAAPLTVRRQVVGCLQVYFPDELSLTASKIRMVTALAQLVSLQMELAELDQKTERLAKAELAALQAQISPHFVYNTLNTIVSLIRTEPETARRLLTDFAGFLRRTLKRRSEFSPFAQELEYVHEYLSFERARFGERLNVVYRVDPEILSTVVPILVLQPLVENAVRHGIGPRETGGRIVIAAEDRGNECWISVEDDGVGMEPERASALLHSGANGGLGLANVNDRLRSVYGAEHGLQVVSTPGSGTRVSFSVPKYKSGVAV